MIKHTIPTSNYSVGRSGYKPEAFVIHIQQGTQIGTISHFKDPTTQVSSHIAVSKVGGVDKFVEEVDIAYHAGRWNMPIWAGMKKNIWGGYINANYYTIGIECEGFRGDIWTEAQMIALVEYVKMKAGEYGIPLNRRNIISHNEITADKEDMRSWCDEIVKRVNQATAPISTPKQEIVALLEKTLKIAKENL